MAIITLQDDSETIQAYLQKITKESLDWNNLDLGDIVACRGYLSKSGKGQLYCEVDELADFAILNKTFVRYRINGQDWPIKR